MTPGEQGRDLAAIGGPLGAYAARRRFAALVWPFVLLAVVPVQLGLFQKAYCIDHGWTTDEQFTRACYSDLPVQFSTGDLAGGLSAYLSGTATASHPPVTGAVMAVVGGLVGEGSYVAQQRQYFLLWAVLAAALLMGIVWLTAASRPEHSSLASVVALSPVIVTVGLVSADLVGVALASAAVFAWARRRPALAGILFGLAVAARTYPVLIVLVIAVLGVRAGRTGPVRRLVAATLGTAAVAFAAGWLLNPRSLDRAYGGWWNASAGLGSPWVLPQLAGSPLPPVVVSILAVLGVVLALALGAVLALTAPRRPSIAAVSVIVLGIVLLTGKAYTLQSALWLLPLLALAGVAWRDHLLWAGSEVASFAAVNLYTVGLARSDRGLPPGWYAVFVVVRVVVTAYVLRRVWRAAMAVPAHDPDPDWPQDPDRDELVDETAGPFTDAPDAVIATLR